MANKKIRNDILGVIQVMKKVILFIITIILVCSNAPPSLCEENSSDENLQEKINLWADQLTTSKGSRLLHEMGQQYGYKVLQGTKIVPILIQNLQPLLDNHITSEGQGEYIGQCIEVLGHIGDKRALSTLKKIDQPIAIDAIREIQNSED